MKTIDYLDLMGFQNDDEPAIYLKWQFGKNYSKSFNIRDEYQNSPIFAFDYLITAEHQYSFTQHDIDKKDWQEYFKKIKEITLNGLQYFEDTKNCTLPDKNPNKILKETLKFAINEPNLDIDVENLILGHFSLYTPHYTEREQAEKEGKKLKAPRIHFFVGHLAIIYIFAYDPFHEIHQTKN